MIPCRCPLILLIVLSVLAAFSSAQETTTTSKRLDLGRPTDTICIQVVCPSTDATSTEPTCPDYCKNDCTIIQDVCCENQMVAICNDEGHSTSGTAVVSTSRQSSLAPTAPSSSGASLTNAPSSVNVQSTLVPSDSPSHSATTTSSSNSQHGDIKPGFVAAIALLVLCSLLQA